MSAARPCRARGAMPTLAALVVATCVLGAGAVDAGARAAAATSVNRAVVVVDLGDEVKTEGITFTEDSISGIEALQRAGMEPATRGFGGTGVAVCALCGRGCPTDGSCLTCGGASYWGYWRAPAGATSYTYSPSGAGGVRVRDGDVEAWKWGSGTPPAFVSFASVWDEPTTVPPTAPPTSPPRPPASSPPATPGGGGEPGAGGEPGPGPSSPNPGGSGNPGDPASGAGGGGAPGGDPGPTEPGAPDTPGGPAAPDGLSGDDGDAVDGSERGADGAAAAAAGRESRPSGPVAPVVEDPAGGSAWGVLTFGLLAAGLTGWAVWARRRRHRGATAAG